jgi:hypothetical protein
MLFSRLAQPCLGDIIDQSYIPVTGQGFNTSFSGNLPIGQEFTPALSSLNFVDLFIGDAGSDIGPGASFQVVIHSGTIGGSVLGTSTTSFVADNTNLGVGLYANFIITRFAFSAPVTLVPGSLDVIEFKQLAPILTGNFNFLAYGGPLNGSTYAGGKGIVNGSEMAGFDFAFREGITSTVPEPSTAIVAMLGAVAFIAYGWSSHRRAQRQQAAA